LQGKLGASIQTALWDRVLSLPLSFFRKYASGDLAMRGLSISQIRTILTSTALSSLSSVIFSIASFGLLFYYSPRLAISALLLTGFAVLVVGFCTYRQLQLQRKAWSEKGFISGLLQEFMTAIAKLRIAGAEPRAFATWVQAFIQQKVLDYSTARVNRLGTVFTATYLPLCLAVLFFVNSSSSVTGQTGNSVSTGHFLAFIAAFGQFLGAVLSLSATAASCLSAVPLYERMLPILRETPELLEERPDIGDLVGGIDCVRLAFQYQPDTPFILRDITFSIRPGEYIAFVGPSGCGKSTLCRLLLGLEEPQVGAIYFDGRDLASVDPRSLRRRVGSVLQGSTLASGTIFENIRGGAPITLEDAWEAVRLVGLEKAIKKMPMGMYTLINEQGSGLSGGQRQQVLIARAIVRRPRILVFDEATSALDNESQAIVSNSLKELKATRIAIAHRLSTIIEADRIFVMDDGKIVQSGTYKELVRQPGLFGKFAQRQLAS
jgi:NHLM bacteriocin system ABC transporter ATP-binding protein